MDKTKIYNEISKKFYAWKWNEMLGEVGEKAKVFQKFTDLPI